MPPNQQSSRICVWLDPAQAAWVRAAAAAADLTIVGAGSWAKGQSASVAAALHTSTMDDLRAMVASSETDAVFIADAGDFGSRPEDLRAIAAARQRGIRLGSLDPIPQSVFDLTHLWRSESDLEDEDGQRLAASQLVGIEQVIRPIGLASRSPVLADASEALAAFGTVRTAVLTVHGLMGQFSLASRLVGAFDLLSSVMPGADYPSWIDAARANRGHVQNRPATPPESLRGIDGDLCALVRLSDGRSATIHVSDWAASVGFDLRLYSPQGAFQIDPSGYCWTAPDGSNRARVKNDAIDPAFGLGAQLRAWLTTTQPDSGPMVLERALTAAHTALLSAHTGHPESPSTLLEMARRLEP